MNRQSRSGANVNRQERGRRRADALLEAATDVLVDEGYSALTLRRVAEKAGVGLSHLQYYFPSRDALLQAMFARTVREYEQGLLAKASKREARGEEGLVLLVNYTLAFFRSERACRSSWELWALAGHDEGAANALNGYLDLFCKIVAELIRQARPDLSSVETARRAAVVVSMLEGASLLRGHGKPRRRGHRGFGRSLRQAVLEVAASPRNE